jgi:hypothetical protein
MPWVENQSRENVPTRRLLSHLREVEDSGDLLAEGHQREHRVSRLSRRQRRNLSPFVASPMPPE